LLAGCGPTRPTPADPDRGKEALAAVLDAWKRGDKPESLRRQSPPIHASDPAWSAGVKLERYEIKGEEGKLLGYDFSCPVTLWLRDGPGDPRPRTVHFTVGTHPELVVVRDFGG
jgi:hypothetical protein